MKASVEYSEEDVNRLIARDILTKFHQKIEPHKVAWHRDPETGNIYLKVDIGEAVKETNR